MSRLKITYEALEQEPVLTSEGMGLALESESEDSKAVYVLLTDTMKLFAKVSKAITKDPYNHVSLALDEDFETIYTYSLTNFANGFRGGLKRENRDILRGSRYSLYRLNVSDDVYAKITSMLDEQEKNIGRTRYNHLGLINAIFQRDIFGSSEEKMICSEFVYRVLDASGVELFQRIGRQTLRPYEFVKSKLLKFVRRGVVK